jgi:L-threonylcarbamoyladenylate synthase
MRRVFVEPAAPQLDALEEAAKWIRNGGLVALPTDTLYGLAADPYRADAVARLFAVKGRSAERGLPLIAADTDQVARHIGRFSRSVEQLAYEFWPGPLTLLVAAPIALVPAVTGGTGRVGVRVPANDVARAICRFAERPVTATSANRSGQPPTAYPDEVERTLGGDVDLLIDAGPTGGGEPSTIVDVAGPEPFLVRAGAIPWERIQAWLATHDTRDPG